MEFPEPSCDPELPYFPTWSPSHSGIIGKHVMNVTQFSGWNLRLKNLQEVNNCNAIRANVELFICLSLYIRTLAFRQTP